MISLKNIEKVDDEIRTYGGFPSQIKNLTQLGKVSVIAPAKDVVDFSNNYEKLCASHLGDMKVRSNIISRNLEYTKIFKILNSTYDQDTIYEIRLPDFLGIFALIYFKLKKRQNFYVRIIANWQVEQIIADKILKKAFFKIYNIFEKFLVKHVIGIDQTLRYKNLVYFPSTIIERKQIINSLRDEEKKYDFIYVGRLEKVKGADRLLQICKALKKHKLNICIIGDGKYFNDLAKLGLENVSLLGRIRHDEILAEIRKSKVLLLPSLSEGSPKVVLEAWSQGVPVLATTAGFYDRFLKDSQGGTLFDGSFPHDVIKAYAIVMSKYEEFSTASLKLAASFTVEQEVILLGNIIDEVQASASV